MYGIENRKDSFKSSPELLQDHYGELVALKKPLVKADSVSAPSKKVHPAEMKCLVIPSEEKKSPFENPFLVRLGQWKVQPKQATPVHHFRSCLEDIKKCKEKGDYDGWNEHLKKLNSRALAARIDPATDLRTQVELSKGEIDLLYNALTKKVIPEREALLEKEEAARDENRLEEAEQYSTQVKKLDRLAQWLEGQIMEKTELVLI